ncbi:MAG: hypothetical protein LAO31_20145 [Acidobacteriia bacterium]|nr:hypothetical protein [Terriglobia bacterium]
MKDIRRSALVLIGMLGLASQTFAGPVITRIVGTLTPGESLRIIGNGFGTKEPAKPYVWADFSKDINPSPLGIKTRWDLIQNIGWSPDDGGTAKSNNGKWASWTLRADFKYWTDDGRRIYLYRRTRMNFVITNVTQSWVTWMMWADMKTPAFAVGASSGGAGTIGLTPMAPTGFWCNERNPTTRIPDTNWHTEEFIFKSSSAPGVFDGSLDIRMDGQSRCSGSVMTRDGHNPGLMNNNFVVHMVGNNVEGWNPPWDPNNTGWADDVYADTTWARVMVGNAPRYQACTRLVPQIPTGWSDTSITVIVNKGPFKDLCSSYLYVVDEKGDVNKEGYPLSSNCENSMPSNH